MTASHRFNLTLEEIKRHRGFVEKQGEPTYVDAEFDTEPHEFVSTKPTLKFKIAKGDLAVKKWIMEKGLKKCLKRDATCLLIIGELTNGAWKKGVKFYWLIPV